MLNALEIFSGGGGLSLGLKRAGISPLVAVELDNDAAETYRANHPNAIVFENDIRDIRSELLAQYFPDGKIDLLAACPPCQGFSSLTAKYRRDDERNKLVYEVARLARDLRPAAIMFENVPGLARKGETIFKKLVSDLERDGYICEWDVLQVADYGVAQTRRRLVLVAGLGYSVSLPRKTHSREGQDDLSLWRTLRDAIDDLPVASQYNPKVFRSDWHVFRRMSDANVKRLKYAKPGGNWSDIPEQFRPPCHRDGYKGFSNAYGRLTWDEPSPTITGGCTSLSKGRVGHPEELRTITVREAALIQSFPNDYEIRTTRVDKACEIIGNALPPWFAEAIASSVRDRLKRAEPWLDHSKLDARLVLDRPPA